MFRKQDFKKVDLLGSGNSTTTNSLGKKNTKIYKAEHLPTGKIYAIKEVEAKTLEKLNEYKVTNQTIIIVGRGSLIVKSIGAYQCATILRLLFLRDNVQHVQNCNGLRVHGVTIEA